MNWNVASKWGWRSPPACPPLTDVASPAPSTSGAENVWSPNEPLVVALEMRRLCWPKTAAVDPEFATMAASKPPVFIHPPWPLMLPGAKDGRSKSVPSVSAPATAGRVSIESAAIAAPVVQ